MFCQSHHGSDDPEILDMWDRAAPDSVGRRLAERCLELCFQEIVANDEAFELPPLSVIDDLARTLRNFQG